MYKKHGNINRQFAQMDVYFLYLLTLACKQMDVYLESNDGCLKQRIDGNVLLFMNADKFQLAKFKDTPIDGSSLARHPRCHHHHHDPKWLKRR